MISVNLEILSARLRQYLHHSKALYFNNPYYFVIAAALLTVVGLLAAHMWMHRYFNIDDVYITYRYAENFSMGRGFVFNEGERVEGCSCFLYCIILSIPLLFGAEVVLASKIIGAVATIVLVLYMYALVKMIYRDVWGRALGVGAAFLAVASTPLAVWSQSGMETNIFALFLFVGIYYYIRSILQKSSPIVWPVIMALTSLIRPEGFMYFFLILFLNLIRDIAVTKNIKTTAWHNLKHLLFFLMVFGPFLVFRLLYFGEFVPNSVIAKNTFQNMLLDAPIKEMPGIAYKSAGMKTLKNFIINRFGFLLLLSVFPLVSRRARWCSIILLTSSLAVGLVCVWNEGGWMPHNRLLIPMIPLVITCAALGLRILFDVEHEEKTSKVLALALTIAVVLISSKKLYYLHKPEKNVWERHVALIEMGKKLGSVREGDDVLATDIAGRVAFYSKMKTIDMMGLCDPYIAHHGTSGGLYGKQNKSYVIQQKPTFIVVNNTFEWKNLINTPGFMGNYWVVTMPDYWRLAKFLFVRKDRKNMSKLLATMQGYVSDPVIELRNKH